MNFNVAGYIIFFMIMFYVIGVVGWKLYTHGRPFMVNNMKEELHLVDPINKLLLLGYYLFNLGYVAISIQNWEQLTSIEQLINLLGVKSGTIIIALGLMHYFNMYWLTNFYKISRKLKNINKLFEDKQEINNHKK